MPDKKETFDINGVEIFAEGTWNGDKFTKKDLDHMVDAFEQVDFTPPLKLGHNAEQEKDLHKDGQPAFGWTEKIYRVGDKLLADFKQIPKVLFDAIERGNFKHVSSEIWFNYKHNGVILPRVLKAVALLGADVPAVTSLEAIEQLYNKGDDHNADELKVYALWTRAFINNLPDASFAVILPDGERKLPHHDRSVESGTENNSVDEPHLRNALARLSQTDLSAEQKSDALIHLRAHAKALKVGEVAELASKQIAKEVAKMDELDRVKKEFSESEAKSDLKAKESADKIAELEASDKENAEKLAKLTKENEEKEAALVKQAEASKKTEIAEFVKKAVEDGRILPRQKDEVEALLFSVDSEVEVFTFTDKDKKEEKLNSRQLVEHLFTQMPKLIDYGEFSEKGSDEDTQPRAGTDAGAEVDRLAKLAMKTKKFDGGYKEALEFVLDEHADLKERYYEKEDN